MRGLLAVTLLTACGGASIEDDGTCSLTKACGGGQVCDFTAEGGQPLCIPADGDLDGDGLPNSMDFCNHQPGGAYDEDQDGIGDDCDRCPIAPPREFPDNDNDEVDAPCDPEPSMDGNEIILFDGFQGAALDARWEPTTDTAWEHHPGEVMVKLDTVTTQEFLKTTVVGKNSLAIEASYRIDKLETTSSRHLVGVDARDPRPAGTAMMQCYATVADQTQAELVVIETNQSAANMPTSDAFNPANLYRAGGQVSGTRAACVIISNGNPLGSAQTSITSDQLTSIALTAHAATVRFQYILVVGR